MRLTGKTWFKCGALMVAMLCLGIGAMAATKLSDYRFRIERAIELLRDTPRKNFDSSSQQKLESLLPSNETVVSEDTSIDVDNSWISAEVKVMNDAKSQADKDKAYDGILKRLQIIASDIDKLEQDHNSTADIDKAKMREILNRREFAVQHGESFLQRILSWIAKKIEALFSFLPKRGATFNKVLRFIIVVVAIIVAVVFGVFLYRHFKRDRKVKSEFKRTIFGEEITEETTSESLADSAKVLAEQGDFRGAIRKLYVSLLFELERQGLLRLQPSATNREYLDKIRKQIRLYPVMAHLTDKFDYFWYGKFTSSQGDFDDFFARYREALDRRPVSA
ncbi:MAG TPA: DUF4129 domain-containing protein [Blastocatellia bacterium]|nr:DUF4129 domain-containing protein [Blastocatellia bacterium]